MMNRAWVAAILALGCLGPFNHIFAQSEHRSPAAELDHVALHVHDLQKSAGFYENVLGLKRTAEPFKDGRHVWFRLGAHTQLHLIGGAPEASTRDIDVHLALRVPSWQKFLEHLEHMKVKYFSTKKEAGITTVRPDRVKQVYLQDPDGYWIEINDSR